MTTLNRRELLTSLGIAALPTLVSADSHAAEATTTLQKTRVPAGVFESLPVGSVRPTGWLRRQLEKQAHGVLSHLPRLYAPFTGSAWLADEPDPTGRWWAWEVRGYWCDGTLRCGLQLDDEALIDAASRPIRWTFSHAAADGYLGPTVLREDRDANRWPHAVFFRAAMALHDATGDPAIVETLQRHYLGAKFNYIADRATTNVEAMLWTYDRTGEQKLLDLAVDSWSRSQKFLAMSAGSYGLTEHAWREPGPSRAVHGVTYAELSKIPALLYRATGERNYLDAAIAAQEKIFAHHLLVDGAPSTTEALSTTTARDAHETCDVVDYPWNWGYLLMATGHGRYGDHIERAAFNALPGSLRKDWKALQYYSSPNQFICTSHSDHIALMKGVPESTIREFRYLQRMSYRPSPGYSVVCCPGNLTRALPNYIARMWMLDSKGAGIAATTYGPSTVKCRVGTTRTEIEIREATNYPYSDRIAFHVHTARPVEFPLHLRIPLWCTSPSLTLNGQPLALPPARNGFIVLRRAWRQNDHLELQLPMTIETTRWPDDGVAIERGPLVYALPIESRASQVADEQSSAEFPAWDLEPTSRWNYTLLPDTADRKPAYQERAATDDPWATPPASITVAAKRVAEWELVHTTVSGEPATLTPRLPDPALLANQATGPVEYITLVPYASTELRLTIFPRLKT